MSTQIINEDLANRKYNEKSYDRLYPYVKKGRKEVYEDTAKKLGMTLNEFIIAALDEKVEKDEKGK